MRIAQREYVLLLATGAIALYAGSATFVKPQLDKWKDLRKQREGVAWQIERDKDMVSKKPEWEQQFADLRRKLPSVAPGRKIDVHWLSVMDTTATKHGLKISKREAGEENKVGDIFELPIQCREWSGTLDALVHFLFDLQSQGAMLDVRQLLIKPAPKDPNDLRGQFTLYCVYTREEQQPPTDEREGEGS